jgi:acyl-coenzyme A synthetase/AMP-(fatty) acid ligase
VSALIQPGCPDASGQQLPLLACADLDRTLVLSAQQHVSAGNFLADVLALAEQLPPGRFAVNLCEDRYQFLRAFCAVALAGQTNLLPASRAPQAIADVLRGHPAAYAIVDDPARVEQAHCFELPRATASAAAAPPRIPLIAREHVVAIGFTSGSTGVPKPNAKTWASVCASSALNAELLDVGDHPANIVATVPPQHMYGLETSVLLPLRSRAAIHYAQPFFPADIAGTLAATAVPRILVTTPFHLRTLLRDDAALPALRAIVTATAPLSCELAADAERSFHAPVIELFGSTETCVIAHRRTVRDEPWQLYAGIELQPQPDGTLVHAGHFAAPTLLQDIVELVADRRFNLRGRNSDLLEIAGKRASLADLTRQLLAIPGVRDGVVFQLDADERGLCRLAALIVAPALTAAQVVADLRRVIDPVFLPRPLLRVDALPRNGAGKLPRESLLAALKN